ncbi:MAG: M24 family metallopeptidase [Terriglobia bacterium]
MNADSTLSYFEARRRRFRERLCAQRLTAFLTAKPANVFYLTGFRGSAGVVLVDECNLHLLVDPRYTLQAREQAKGAEVIETHEELLRAAARRLRRARKRRVGFEDSFLTAADFQVLLRESGAALQWQPSGGLIEELRVIKDEREISLIRQACQLTSRVFEQVARKAKPGVSELDLAAELEFLMRRQGAEGVAFESIVASGPRGALPHAAPSAKLLAPGELVIFDLGAVVEGYCSDMTRTLYLGEPNRRTRILYRAVSEAQQAAVRCLRAGAQAGDIDAEARSRLAARNLGEFFTHSTGHGVGIEIHERPRIGRSVKFRIPARAVVTVEPGIYLEGLGGIRIEDSVLIGETDSEVLTNAPKDDWFTG